MTSLRTHLLITVVACLAVTPQAGKTGFLQDADAPSSNVAKPDLGSAVTSAKDAANAIAKDDATVASAAHFDDDDTDADDANNWLHRWRRR
jgi:hypothetical protein